jgi:hypothetical protein
MTVGDSLSADSRPRCLRLFHFTTDVGAAAIEAADRIDVTWPQAAPVVAWFTTANERSTQGWKNGAGAKPLTRRYTVAVPEIDAHRWDAWKHGHVSAAAIGSLERWARWWWDDPARWYVVERAVLRPEWVEVADVSSTPLPRSDPRPPSRRS